MYVRVNCAICQTSFSWFSIGNFRKSFPFDVPEPRTRISPPDVRSPSLPLILGKASRNIVQSIFKQTSLRSAFAVMGGRITSERKTRVMIWHLVICIVPYRRRERYLHPSITVSKLFILLLTLFVNFLYKLLSLQASSKAFFHSDPVEEPLIPFRELKRFQLLGFSLIAN